MTAKFALGQTVSARDAFDTLNSEDVVVAMVQHAAGDWGDLGEEDRQANVRALAH